jgi:hypothetical protein
MIAVLVLGSAICACALAELLYPGQAVYHAGWLNVAVAAAAVLVISGTLRSLRRVQAGRARIALVAFAFGTVMVAVAVVSSGLLAPDNHSVVGAPGQSVRSDELGGSLVFPFVGQGAPQPVVLERGGNAQTIENVRLDGSFLLHAVPRTVVAVEARDTRGGRLTITQPTGSVFLSPVLLMQGTQNLAGMSVAFDSFAVPAAHHVVKAVLFTPDQTVRLPAATSGYAVLFDVEDDAGNEAPHGIGLARDGVLVTLGGLQLRPHVLTYPAIDVIAIPDVTVTIAGILLALLSGAAAVFFESRLTPRAASQ